MINSALDQTNNGIIEKYCYNNDTSNCAVYGGLYQWDEIMQYVTTEGTQGICPSGWHIPMDAEWCTVTEFLYPTGDCSSGSNEFAGGKMKSTGTIEAGTGLWHTPNEGATNESGFSAIPAGNRVIFGLFSGIGNFGRWWSSTVVATDYGLSRRIYYGNGTVRIIGNTKDTGFSVRCLRDF